MQPCIFKGCRPLNDEYQFNGNFARKFRKCDVGEPMNFPVDANQLLEDCEIHASTMDPYNLDKILFLFPFHVNIYINIRHTWLATLSMWC